jgi:YidC/Oxa1 family membrane protein insertase
MDIKKIVIYIVVAILGVALYNAWIHDYPPSATQTAAPQTTSPANNANYSPSTFNPASTIKTKPAGNAVPNASTPSTGQRITVKTDVLNIQIDKAGGNIVAASLPKYPVSLQQKDVPVQILTDQPEQIYIAQSGLTNSDKSGQAAEIKFNAPQSQYVMANDQKQLVVQLKGVTSNGLTITKVYLFNRNSYAIHLSYQIENHGSKAWAGSLFTQLTRRQPPEEKHTFYTKAYDGAAVSSPETPYEKIPYKTLDKGDISRNVKGGWVAMQQHYFLSTWIPVSQNQYYRYYSHVVTPANDGAKIYIIGFVSPQMNIAPGATGGDSATIYVGPEIASNLRTLAPGLDHTIDYGWLWPISVILFWIMAQIFSVVKNWGWTIVITTILIKIVFYWFSAKSFRSMAKMREMQPRIQALKERFGNDRQALSKATMELYRKEKINPLGGCLPLVVQIPVFIAFYYVIIESVQLRQAPFIFWIHDLSVKDPYYILPILMGLSMLVQQIISPTSPDPAQQKMMWILPIVFTVFFFSFPAGLVLYWFVNNVVQVLQQWYVMKTYEKHKAKIKSKRERK